jgi:hypothetical protein
VNTPRIEGSLAQRDFPSLIQQLYEQRWSGVLTLSHAGVARSVTVQDGRMVFASSTSPDDRLGELLLRRGRISFRQYYDAGKAVVPGKRFGTILVEQGVLTPKELVKAVTEHTQEIIYGAFLWTEGHYRGAPAASSSEAITLKISTPDVILEGVRRIESWDRIERGVGGLKAVYTRAEDYESMLPQMSLSFEKLSILTDVEVCRTLWAFRVIGVVWLSDQDHRAQDEGQDEGLGFVLAEE